MLRAGIGYDIHRLEPGRKLVIGGVEIPFEKGLLGHSDADVLLHAICDALLGAAGLPDIGNLFPDTDPRWKGADSRSLLTEVWGRVLEKGFREIINVDSVIMAQRPKIAPFRVRMRERIAAVLEIGIEKINIKATTMEQMGPVGREEGIAAQAVVLID